MVTECSHIAGLESLHARIIGRATNANSVADLLRRLAKGQECEGIIRRQSFVPETTLIQYYIR